MQSLLSRLLSKPPKHSSSYFFSHSVSKTTYDPPFSPISKLPKPPKPKPKKPEPAPNRNPTPINSSLPFYFRHSCSETNPTLEPIGFREPKRFSPFGPGRLRAPLVWLLTSVRCSWSSNLTDMLFGSATHCLVEEEGIRVLGDPLTEEEIEELVEKDENNVNSKLRVILRSARNGVYVNVVARVREAFETEEVITLDCTHVGTSDCKRIGVKLRDLVPCVPILFKDEQIKLWRGKRDQERNSDTSDANENYSGT
ncbi:hypothetical protein CXB51_010029 [Gossypium anomalum]|uniref:CRM domain-containing protein n=1 Tax=Gossypium anomalum TaxID=47600 RepID=A0A8J6D2J8_9ROSI|nr:hypothetical protein CXB51_010029 [Gossypium anomalum]